MTVYDRPVLLDSRKAGAHRAPLQQHGIDSRISLWILAGLPCSPGAAPCFPLFNDERSQSADRPVRGNHTRPLSSLTSFEPIVLPLAKPEYKSCMDEKSIHIPAVYPGCLILSVNHP